MSGKQREVYSLSSAVVIGFGGGLRVEEIFLASLEGMLQFWEETRKSINQPRSMVTLKGRFKGDTGGNWYILPLVDVTGLVIYISK